MFQDYAAFTDGIRKSGHYKAGDPLQPTSTATTVRVKNGKTVPTDGPFAETRAAGRLLHIQAGNLDEATEIAARIPERAWAPSSAPIMEMSG
jgi:hypothetical protein